MAVIPVNLDDLKESKPVPVGKYQLTVVGCEEVLSKKGNLQYDMTISIDGHEDAPTIRHFQSLPAEGDKPSARDFKALLLKRLCHLMGKPISGQQIDTTAIAAGLVGQKCKADVGMDKETDADGNEKVGGRVYNRLVVPYLPDEGGAGRIAPQPPKR